jgi:hypothetical protein
MDKIQRCEGWIRKGGAFTFGPVVWEQCDNVGVVMIRFTENNEEKTLPACMKCWQKCIETGINIIEVVPIIS